MWCRVVRCGLRPGARGSHGTSTGQSAIPKLVVKTVLNPWDRLVLGPVVASLGGYHSSLFVPNYRRGPARS